MGKTGQYFQLKEMQRKIKHKERKISMEIFEELCIFKIQNVNTLIKKANTMLVSYALSCVCCVQRLSA